MSVMGGAAGLLLLATFVLYPAVVCVAARLRPRPHRPNGDHQPPLTVVVAACNEAAVIGARIDDIFAQDYPDGRVDVVVVTDGSSDGTERVALEAAERAAGAGRDVRVLHVAERAGKAAALNRALPCVGGEVVVYTDADTTFAPGTLRKLATHFADTEIGSVTGARHVRPAGCLDRIHRRYQDRLLAWESKVDSAVGAAGEVLAVRRSLVSELDERVVNEDFARAMAVVVAGRRHIFDAEIRAYEGPAATSGGASRVARRARIQAGRLLALRRGLLAPGISRRSWVGAGVVFHKGLPALAPFALLVVLADWLTGPEPLRAVGVAVVGVWGVAGMASTLASTAMLRSRRKLPPWAALPAELLLESWGVVVGTVWAVRGRVEWPRPGRTGCP